MAITSLSTIKKLGGKILTVTNQNFANTNTYYTIHNVSGTGQIRLINISWGTFGSSAINSYRLTVDGNVISTANINSNSVLTYLGLNRTSLTETPLTISFKNSFLFEGLTTNFAGVAGFNSICIYDLEQ